ARRLYRELRCALVAIEHERYRRVLDLAVGDGRVQRVQRDARSARRAIGGRRQLPRAFRNRVLELAGRDHAVDELPLDGALALHSLDERAEEIGEVAAHMTLVDDAREAAGAGKHAEQRRFRQADGGVAVVDEDDLVAGERELVAAAGADAVERGKKLDAGML